MGSTGESDLAARVRRVIDENVYMVLGTADEKGRPWVSPVFYGVAAYRDFFWVSSPEVTHSRNLARRPQLSIVVFDSHAALGTGASMAVYMAATATEVAANDLAHTLSTYPGFSGRGGREFTPAELQAPTHLRLYRATVTDHYVLCPLEGGGVPCADHGLTYDHRTQVALQ